MLEVIIQILVKICSECPFFKMGPYSTTDGFDVGNDWICTKENKLIAGFVEWREKDQVEIPKWCPFK